MSGNLKHLREMSGIMLTVRELSGKSQGKIIVRENWPDWGGVIVILLLFSAGTD